MNKTSKRLNYVVIMCDDIGWGDLGCYGHPEMRTPHLDGLAAEGCRFTSFYSGQPVCSASRAALLTGSMPGKAGVLRLIGSGTGGGRIGPGTHLARNRRTLAQLLKEKDYHTAVFGKWHLGFLEPEFNQAPNQFGFDYSFCTVSNSAFRDPDNWHRNGRALGGLRGHPSDLVATDVARWLEEERSPDQPFFFYLPFHAPHEPVGADEPYLSWYDKEEPEEKRHYYGTVSQMDAACGKVFEALRQAGEWERTVVLFTSDHGPEYRARCSYGSAGPFRGKKLHLYEGGIRVPGVLRWPGHTEAGEVKDVPLCNFDLLPTVCEAEGVPLPESPGVDGTSFLPVLEGNSLNRRHPLAWDFPMAMPKEDDGPVLALRKGDWKLLLTRGGGAELYDLANDREETHNLCEREPERVREMTAELKAIHEEVEGEGAVARRHMDCVPAGLESRQA